MKLDSRTTNDFFIVYSEKSISHSFVILIIMQEMLKLEKLDSLEIKKLVGVKHHKIQKFKKLRYRFFFYHQHLLRLLFLKLLNSLKNNHEL